MPRPCKARGCLWTGCCFATSPMPSPGCWCRAGGTTPAEPKQSPRERERGSPDSSRRSSTPPSESTMLKRIKVQGYKSLTDLEVELKPLSVLFGPHASGKSNLLEALHLLSRLAVSKTLKEAFAP